MDLSFWGCSTIIALRKRPFNICIYEPFVINIWAFYKSFLGNAMGHNILAHQFFKFFWLKCSILVTDVSVPRRFYSQPTSPSSVSRYSSTSLSSSYTSSRISGTASGQGSPIKTGAEICSCQIFQMLIVDKHSLFITSDRQFAF